MANIIKILFKKYNGQNSGLKRVLDSYKYSLIKFIKGLPCFSDYIKKGFTVLGRSGYFDHLQNTILPLAKLFHDCCLWLKDTQKPIYTFLSPLNRLTGPPRSLITYSFRKWESFQESHFLFLCLSFFTWEMKKDLRKKYLPNTSEELWGEWIMK